jgi:RHS repeat-associated protein
VEHEDIIHMNGRIYDPTLGRFLQADPFIQAPNNSQNYNRYSYVLNNPMSYTDPSGYLFKALGKFVKKHWKTIVQIGISVMTAGAGLAWAMAGGALSGYVMTGSLKGALVGAFTGALFYGAGDIIANNGISNVLAKGAIRGLAGGISSVLSGGKFGHGFAAAGVTSMAGGKIDAAFKDTGARVVAAAVLGGTVSQVTGGKFANGAMTAAFMKAYNDANHPTTEHPDAPLGKWFRSIADTAAQIRGSIESGLSSIGDSLNSFAESLTPTGVLAVGIESTSVFTVAGQKGGVECLWILTIEKQEHMLSQVFKLLVMAMI